MELPILQIKETPDITETVTTQHHEAPRFIYAAENGLLSHQCSTTPIRN